MMVTVESAQERGLSAGTGMSETSAAHGETVESVRGEEKARPDAGTEFLGVRRRPCGSYGAQIWDRSRRTNVWLGTFGTAEDAAKAYDAAAVELQTTGRAVKKKTAARPDAWTEFHGVYRKRSGKYRARIWHPLRGTKVHLGTFGTPEEAARAYDAAAVELDGAAAKTNFKVVNGIGVQAVGLEKAAAGSSASHGVYQQKSGKCSGTFDKAEDAASASDAEAVRLHGERAITNLQQPHMDLNDFPELPALDISTIPGAQLDDLWTYLLQAELQPVDELLQDMDFNRVAA